MQHTAICPCTSISSWAFSVTRSPAWASSLKSKSCTPHDATHALKLNRCHMCPEVQPLHTPQCMPHLLLVHRAHCPALPPDPFMPRAMHSPEGALHPHLTPPTSPCMPRPLHAALSRTSTLVHLLQGRLHDLHQGLAGLLGCAPGPEPSAGEVEEGHIAVLEDRWATRGAPSGGHSGQWSWQCPAPGASRNHRRPHISPVAHTHPPSPSHVVSCPCLPFIPAARPYPPFIPADRPYPPFIPAARRLTVPSL